MYYTKEIVADGINKEDVETILNNAGFYPVSQITFYCPESTIYYDANGNPIARYRGQTLEVKRYHNEEETQM